MKTVYYLQVMTKFQGWQAIHSFEGREGLDWATDFARRMFASAPPMVHFRVVTHPDFMDEEVYFTTEHSKGVL